MAGSNPRFDAATFRSNILSAMTMALPNTTNLQPTFRWIVKPAYTTADPAGRPYSWTQTAAGNSPSAIADLQVPCAVQIGGGSETGTEAGFENELNAVITLLDTQQAQLIAQGGRMPDQVLLAGATYNVDYVLQTALFSVDVYEMHLKAQDQA